jgi:uncharacterized protein (TIGR02246 family)
MKTNLEVRHIAVSISRPAPEVYEFTSNPENLPRWATGLAGGSINKEGGDWVAVSPMGKVKIRFAPKNPFGILDHDVILESGITVHNPMRILPNGPQSEVVFTLFRQPDMTGEKFLEDAKWVEKDLKMLKELLEEKGLPGARTPQARSTMLPEKPEDWPRVFTQYLNAGNLEAVMELYEPEARFVTRTGEILTGHDQLRGPLGAMIRSKTKLESRVIKTITVGDIAQLYTDFEGTAFDASGKTTEVRNKAVEVLRRQAGGGWKLIVGNPNARE